MSGIAPFRHAAQVTDRDGTVLADVNASISVRGQEPGSVSEEYTYDATIIGADAHDALVGKQNRLLEVGSDVYRVMEASWRPIVGFVEARLRVSRPNG